MTEVDFGWLMRSAHAWSANLLIGILYLHILTTYLRRAYRRPRELTWVSGMLLFFLFLAFGFSGYLLPWNQSALFATRVGTALVGVIPFVGDDLLLLARGGENVTGDTLARFYALHVAVFPLLAIALLGLHLYLVQKHGMSIPNRTVQAHGAVERVPTMSFVPHFLLRDMVRRCDRWGRGKPSVPYPGCAACAGTLGFDASTRTLLLWVRRMRGDPGSVPMYPGP